VPFHKAFEDGVFHKAFEDGVFHKAFEDGVFHKAFEDGVFLQPVRAPLPSLVKMPRPVGLGWYKGAPLALGFPGSSGWAGKVYNRVDGL